MSQKVTKLYNQAKIKGNDGASSMIIALEKLHSVLVNIKYYREMNDFGKQAESVKEADKILDTLKIAVNFSEEDSLSKNMIYIYEQMRFSLKTMAISKNAAEDFDYFIDFIKRYIQIWKDSKNSAEENPNSQKNDEPPQSIKIQI